MNPSIARKLALIAEWKDKGMDSGLSKSQRGVNELRKRAKQLAVAFTIAAAAIAAGTVALFKFVKQGAEIQSVRDSFEGFIRSANMAPDTLDKITEAVRGTIAEADLMQASIQALSSGLQPDELIRFWEMSKQIADVASRDTLEVFDSLSRAVNKLEAESLETIGITVRMGDVMKDYQEKTGKATKELTLLDRQLAFMNAVNEKYIENFWKVGDVTTRVRERFQRMSAEFKNVRDDFADIVSKSPAVQGFLEYIIDKIAVLNTELAKDDKQIQNFVDSFISLLITIERVARKFWEWKEEVLGVSVGLGVLVKTGNPIAALVVGWATIFITKFKEIMHWIIDVGLSIHLFFNDLHRNNIENIQELARIVPWIGEKIAGTLDATLLASMDKQKAAIEAAGAFMKEVTERYSPMKLLEGVLGLGEKPTLPTPKDEKITPGGLPGFEAPSAIPQRELDAFRDIANQKVEIAGESAELINDIEGARLDNYLTFLYVEESETRKNLADRVRAYDSAFMAMSRYSDKFYKKGASRGRALNAMLIVGFAELSASYIESKTQQARYDALEYAYKAIAAAASQQYALAAGFALAAAQAGTVAGAGALMAGYLRARGQEKADELVRDRDDYEDEAGGDVAGEGQRRRAGGIVKARPIYINVSSHVQIQAGVVSFADAEYGVREFYESYIQDRVEQDIEDGVIAIP